MICVFLYLFSKTLFLFSKTFSWPQGESAFPGCDGESLQLGGVFMIRPVTDRICHFVTRGHGGHQAQGPSKGNGPKSSGRVFSFSMEERSSQNLGERSSQNLGDVALSLSLVKRRPQSFSDISSNQIGKERRRKMLLEWIGQSKAWNAAPSMEHAGTKMEFRIGI